MNNYILAIIGLICGFFIVYSIFQTIKIQKNFRHFSKSKGVYVANRITQNLIIYSFIAGASFFLITKLFDLEEKIKDNPNEVIHDKNISDKEIILNNIVKIDKFQNNKDSIISNKINLVLEENNQLRNQIELLNNEKLLLSQKLDTLDLKFSQAQNNPSLKNKILELDKETKSLQLKIDSLNSILIIKIDSLNLVLKNFNNHLNNEKLNPYIEDLAKLTGIEFKKIELLDKNKKLIKRVKNRNWRYTNIEIYVSYPDTIQPHRITSFDYLKFLLLIRNIEDGTVLSPRESNPKKNNEEKGIFFNINKGQHISSIEHSNYELKRSEHYAIEIYLLNNNQNHLIAKKGFSVKNSNKD